MLTQTVHPDSPLLKKSDQSRDSDLIARARQGDQEACRLIVERYRPIVESTITGMLGPGPEAEDLGQETFLRFFRTIHQYREKASLRTYLSRIASNLTLNALQKWYRRNVRVLDDEEALERDPVFTSDGGHSLDDRERDEIVRGAIQSLKPKLRIVVVLRLIDGYSTQETAEILNIPEGTVLSRLSRAQLKLRSLLAPFMNDYEY